jgi:gas vesicle protein
LKQQIYKKNTIMKTSSTTALVAFLGGAAIGAAVAILFTTEKGAEARKVVADTLGQEFDKLSNKVENLFHPEGKKTTAQQ